MEQTELILLVIKALPYSNQISELTLCDCGGIMFKWREHTFIVKRICLSKSWKVLSVSVAIFQYY